MNKFTQEFHQGQFPGYQPTKSYEEIIDNFWFTSQIPVVDLDLGLNMQSTYQWAVDHNYLFDNQYTQIDTSLKAEQSGHSWFTSPHSMGWDSLEVLGNDLPQHRLVPDNTVENSYVSDYRPQYYPDAVPDLTKEFARLGISVSRIKIFRMAPGGWVQPHMDKKHSGSPIMNHVWLPLHEFDESIKIYPMGSVKHQTNHVYLLNNNDFLHSAINTADQPRYVGIVKLEYNTLPNNIWNQIKESVKQQWF